ncbi:MAG: DUF2892 domain-containing protein [Melioribacteraceae bacterium]|nr:MAG: DUF2892 domain-containing protein [Melioribacteraceae bacterium]
MNKASLSMRVWFAAFGLLILIGIYLTGFTNVHWLLYVPAAGFIFAAASGICPSQLLFSKMLDKK